MSEPDNAAGRVLDAAIRVAAAAPKGRANTVGSALIYWPYLLELREALDAMGIEWRQERHR